MRRLLTLVLVLAACGAPPATTPTAAPSEAVLTPIPRAEIIETPAGSQPPARPGHLENTVVALNVTEFPISGPTSALVRAAIPAPIEGRASIADQARLAVNTYLQALDNYRDTGRLESWQLSGPFRDVVVASLDAPKRAGVQRKFVLDALRVDAVYVKPWGTRALTDVTVTITDSVVSGNAGTEIETGRLRLSGDNRLTVADAWDASARRWFNGSVAPTRDRLLEELKWPFAPYLRAEIWIPGGPAETFYGPGGETPFSRARNALIQTIDRQAIVSRILADVSATVIGFEMSTEIGDGIATVRIDGTVVTKDATGNEKRTPFTKTVRAFRQAFGSGVGSFTVVDEVGPNGAWLSGGDLALKQVDQIFA